MERSIDCFKHRKSTHLSGADVLDIIQKKGKCILIIQDAYYSDSENVAGKNTGGYFAVFNEGLKPAMLNTINKKRIAQLARNEKNLGLKDSRNIKNWVGLRVELIFDETVKFGADQTGGFRVLPKSPIPTISDVNGIKVLNECKTLAELPSYWSKLSKDEQALPTVNALKEKLKTTLK